MSERTNRFQTPVFDCGIIVLVGGFGSGKSEVAVNLARHFVTTQKLPVTLADLDIVNPYFRSREAAKELASLGVKPLIPPGTQVYADLPVIIPEIKGAIQHNEGKLILDVGGDDFGARVLRSLADAFVPGRYDLLLVLNRNRPFTANVEGTLAMINEIEVASGLKFTGIISNTHLLDETTVETVSEGLELAHRVARKSGLPVKLITAVANIAEKLNTTEIDVPLLALDRSLLKPWERRKPAGSSLA